MNCMDCGEEVKPKSLGTYREIVGWEKLRPGGGLNGIVLRRETGKLLCSGCGEKRKLNARWGLDEGQQSLI